jgi:hypothetical protein
VRRVDVSESYKYSEIVKMMPPFTAPANTGAVL